MYVDENQFYTGNSSGRMQGLDLAQPLYLGGVPDFSNIHKQNGFDTGFVGKCSNVLLTVVKLNLKSKPVLTVNLF